MPCAYSVDPFRQIDLLADSVAQRSDCADVQTELVIHCLHMTCEKCQRWQKTKTNATLSSRISSQKMRSMLDKYLSTKISIHISDNTLPNISCVNNNFKKNVTLS